MYMSICWYLRVLQVLHRSEVVDIGVKSYIEKHAICLNSDFIWDFGKLPFPTHLGKYFIRIGKIRAKIHEIGKIKAIFGLGMTPIYGLKNGQIKSLLKDYRIRPFLSIRHAYGDLCKHLGIDSSTDLDDQFSNLFQNAYINRHAHTEYLKMI